ncbi:MAG: hypothetical protein AAGF27_05755 [Pseudomonadota bacterium]
MDADLADQRTAELLALFQERMGVKASTLEKAVARAGRRLPRAVRDQAATLVDAQSWAGNPKLMRQLDSQVLASAYRDIADHLKSIDNREERVTRQLNRLALIAFNLLLVLAAFLAFVWWQGQP